MQYTLIIMLVCMLAITIGYALYSAIFIYTKRRYYNINGVMKLMTNHDGNLGILVLIDVILMIFLAMS